MFEREVSKWHKNHNKAITPYPEGSMYDFLKSTADRFPDFTAIEFEGKKTKFSNFIKSIDEAANSFLRLGITNGDIVTICSPNVTQALTAVYALNKIGAIANMLHPNLSAAEIKNFITDTKSKAVITLNVIYPKFKKMDFSNSAVNPYFILIDIGDNLPVYKKYVYRLKNKVSADYNTNHKCFTWNKFISNNSGNPAGYTNPVKDDVAVILYSGGTTGLPKGVMLTNFNMNVMSYQCLDCVPFDNLQGTRSLALMPIFHGYGLAVSIHAMLCLGFHVFLLPKYDMENCAKLIFKKKIQCIYGVPALYYALSRSVEIEKKDLSFFKLMVISGDRTPEKLMNRMNKYLKSGNSQTMLREAYGQTECVSGCCINPYFALKKGSVGIPFSDMHVIITEPGTINELSVGSTGEICINGPSIMKGYYNNEDETAAVLKKHNDGKIWLHTRDMGRLDEDGYLYYEGRINRMIITSGYNVYPDNIEQVISGSAYVAKCCVIGVPDKIIGEKICAYVVLNNADSKAKAREDIMKLCTNSLAQYSVPHEIHFTENLPATSLGKTDFKAVKESITETSH